MAIWPWYGALAKGLVYDAGEFLQVDDYKNVQRWTDQLATRPAVKRGRMVNRVPGDPASQLRERHDASDFDLRTQDKMQDAACSHFARRCASRRLTTRPDSPLLHRSPRGAPRRNPAKTIHDDPGYPHP